jgi:hypothetical protein
MGHVRLTNTKREAIVKKAKDAFTSNGVSNNLHSKMLPYDIEEALVKKVKQNPYMLELVDFVVKRRSFFEDFVDFSYYDEKDPMSTLFRRLDEDIVHIKDASYILQYHPWSTLIKMFPINDSDQKITELTIYTKEESSHFLYSDYVWRHIYRILDNRSYPIDIIQVYLDAGVTIDELLKIEPYIEFIEEEPNTVYPAKTFDHNETNNRLYSWNISNTNTLPLRNSSPKGIGQSNSYTIKLNNPVFYLKIPGKIYANECMGLTTEDPFVCNVLKSYLIASAIVLKDQGKYMKTIEAVLEMSNTVKQLITLMPSMETFVEQEDLAKTNEKQIKKGSTLEQRQKQLEDLGLDTDKVNQVALTASLEN